MTVAGPPHESTVLESAWLSSARPTNRKILSLEGTDDEQASTTTPFLVRGKKEKGGVGTANVGNLWMMGMRVAPL